MVKKRNEESHLIQVRGLKPFQSLSSVLASRSHLIQVRGLKRLCIGRKVCYYGSHLIQVRGLKLVSSLAILVLGSVAPHTGAWIETPL